MNAKSLLLRESTSAQPLNSALLDTVREPVSRQTGRRGQNEVISKLDRIGWATVPVTEADLGTDLLAQARDSRRFDLGLFVGLQVKTGDSYFRHEYRDERGGLLGWWYYESSTSHFNSWAAHGLPHLLVLHRLGTGTGRSYWVHVTTTAVEVVGKGARILVPVGQEITDDAADALNDVAATQRPRIDHEGSAWSAGVGAVPPGTALRHALLVPRLIVPHRNQGFGKALEPEEALGLLARARARDLDGFRESHPAVPQLARCHAHGDWRWRFVGAVEEAYVTGMVTHLPEVLASAEAPDRRAAAAVVLCVLHLNQDDHEGALAALATAGTDCGPVDHAWLDAHRARILAEIGDVESAMVVAAQSLRNLASAVDDPSASAVRAAASATIFRMSTFEREDVGSMIIAADSAASWWRSQVLATGLAGSLERAFRRERRDQTRRWGAEEAAHNHILSASLTASFAADHSGWAAAARLGAMDDLTARSCGPEDATRTLSTLSTLRRCGDDGSVRLIARSLWETGPLDALVDAARTISAEAWTHTSSTANLALLEQAGDVLTAEDADRHAIWAKDVLHDPAAFVRRVRPNFVVEHYVARALAALLPACSAPIHDEVAVVLGELSPENLAARAQDYARVAFALRPHDVSERAAERLVDLTVEQPDAILAAHALGAGNRSPRARAMLEQRAAEGDREALSLLDPAALPDAVIQTVADQSTALLTEIMEEAENGSFARRHPDPAEALARLGAWHPERIDWEALARYLAHPLVRGAFKRGACQLLAEVAHRLPTETRVLLAGVVGHLADSPLDTLSEDGDGLGAVPLALSIALNAEDSVNVPAKVLAMLNGPPRTRADAGVLIGRSPQASPLLPVLVGMAHDADQTVRVGAAVGLAEHLVRVGESADPMLTQALDTQLSGDGARIAVNVAAVLCRATATWDVLAPVLTRIRDHRSARVRALASDRRDGPESAVPSAR